MILCIETATSVCSVALCDRERIISARENNDGKSHAALLTVFIDQLFRENKITASDLEAVAVSKGPGSFTGLRIGVSVAKGIAFRSSIPLIGIETMLSMYFGIRSMPVEKQGLTEDSLYCPMLDARRMEVYYALFDAMGNIRKRVNAEIISAESFSSFPEQVRILFFGNGASKCIDTISHRNSVYNTDFTVSAKYMRTPAYKAFDSGRLEDTAYFEPFYLKDFIATAPRKSIVGN
jgi:tRNA threonylcarbamoyladenosine biosynthesis protein TsaB